MRTRIIGLAVASALVGGLLSGQQTPVFDATVDHVRVDVIVTDADGRFVDDLRPEEFTVREDGREQQILAFQLVDLATADSVAARIPGRQSPTAGDAPVVASGSTPVPTPSASAVASPTASKAASRQALAGMVFLIDLPGLDWRNKERLADAWAGMLDDTDGFGIPRAVYLIDQAGRLKELAPLTLEESALRQAVVRLRDEPLVRQGIHEQLLDPSGQSTFGRGERNHSNPERAIEDTETPDGRVDERSRSLATLQLLAQFCDALAARSGRTALVWVTSGLQTMEGGPFAALAAARWERTQTDGTFGGDRSKRSGNVPFEYLTPDQRILELQEALHRAANSANVSIYTVDPTPQAEWRSIANRASATADQADLLSSLTVQASLDGLRDALRHAASETGGRSFIGWSELERVLPEIQRDTGRYYLLTYVAPPPLGDGEYHDITVEVTRPGLAVRARRGYVDVAAPQRAERTLDAALTLPGTVTGLPLSARAVRRWRADGEPIVQLIVTVDGLAEVSEQEPVERATLDFRAVAVAEGDRVAAEIQESVIPGSRRSPLVDGVAASDAGGGAVGAGPGDGETPDAAPRRFVYVHDWNLSPGAYDVRVAVRQSATALVGATRLTVGMWPESPEWQASDVLLLAGPDGRARPLARYEIGTADLLAAQLEVKHGARPMMSGEVFTGAGSELIVQLPAVAMAPDAIGVHHGVLRVRGLDPGDYILQVTVTDAEAGKHAVERVEFTVIGG